MPPFWDRVRAANADVCRPMISFRDTDKLVWSKLRVVVTGGAGFLGSHLVESLRARGVLHLFVPRSQTYDLVDVAATRRLLADTRPDVVFHLAARVGGILANQRNPGQFFYDNLLMGVQLLEESRKFGVRKLITTATVCAYPKYTPVPFREEDLWNGYPEETNAPYGLAKKMLLVQSQAYRAQYGFSSVVLFPANLYGPRDHFDLETSHVIPALIRKISQAVKQGHDEVVLFGDGTPTREFLYVQDCAEGILLAAEHYDGTEPVNLGSGHEISIAELAKKIAGLLDYRGRFVYDPSRPNGQPRRALCTSRARQFFGFEPTTSLDQGLRQTIEFFLRSGLT